MRLAHQTFFLLAAAVLVTVGAMALLFALNLEQGFVAYINARQQEQLEVLERLVAAEVRGSGSLERFRADPRAWRRLIQRASVEAAGGAPEFGGDGPIFRREGDEPPPQRRPGDGLAPRRPGDFLPRLRQGPPRGDEPFPPGPPGPLPNADPLALGARFQLLDERHAPVLAPRPVPANAGAPIERPVDLDGRTVAWVRAWPVRHADRPEDVAFLRSQYTRIAWGAGGLVLVTLVVAPLVARRVTQPLRGIATTVDRIARGDFSTRLHSTRSDELGGLMRNVDTMAQALESLEQTRRRWVAEIAHELRTPLTVLQGELEALRDGVRPLEPAAVTSLLEETRHLARLIGDLHQLALADLDALPCTMGPCDLAAIVRRVADRYRPHAAAKGLQLVMAVGKSIVLEADEQRMEQLVANLLENSLRYTDAPGRIALRLERHRNRVELVVEDSPPGVPAAICARLFDPLFRADAARSRKSGGSGLGLAIARAIVRAHGGDIRATPSDWGGLAVKATLPVRS